MKKFGHRDVSYAADFAAARRLLQDTLKEGDLLLTLGAGDVWKVGEEFLKESIQHSESGIQKET
jgi:UDP-N-acetylmuramate--alanine ligase